MTSVIKNTSSLNNSFISTTDHLPCDIIRSIWLVQSCNLSVHKARTRLNKLLVGIQNNQPRDPREKDAVIQEIIQIKAFIKRNRVESIHESQALKNQLIIHKTFLSEELEQLRKIADHQKSHEVNADFPQQDELREQLKQHYEQNPLVSQREAMKEQKELIRSQKELKQSIETISSPGRKKSAHSGLKLVFKVPGAKAKSHIKARVSRGSGVEKPSVRKDQKSKLGRPLKTNQKDQKQKSAQKPKVKKQVELEITPEPEPEDTNAYCFCRQGSFGDMIACDNEDSCPNGEWFHYKCVGLVNRVEALKYTTGKINWYCSDHCRDIVESEINKKKEKKTKKRKKRW